MEQRPFVCPLSRLCACAGAMGSWLAFFQRDVVDQAHLAQAGGDLFDHPAGDLFIELVVVRLPFRVPTDPVLMARLEFIEASGGNPFYDYSLPQATSVWVSLTHGGKVISQQQLPLSALGTFHGSVLLADEAPPGNYQWEIRLKRDTDPIGFGTPGARLSFVHPFESWVIMLTIIGIFFRGPNMALIWPF